MAIALALFLMFIALPILSFPISAIFFLYVSKVRKYAALFMAMSIGLVAYCLDPPVTYDLYRHHQLVEMLAPLTPQQFLLTLSDSLEPIALSLSYIVSQFNNVDILQFIVTSITYWIVIYIIGDYATRVRLSKRYIFLLLASTLSATNFIYVASGLWNNLAIVLFALAVYLGIVKNKGKVLRVSLYLMSILTHVSMLFAVAVLAIWNLFKKRISFMSCMAVVLIFVSPAVILWVISFSTDSPILIQLNELYVSYFVSPDYVSAIYNRTAIIVEMSKLIPVALLVLLYRSNDARMLQLRSLVLLLSLAIIIILPASLIMIRFIFLVQLISLPIVVTVLAEGRMTHLKAFLMVYMVISSVVFAAYQLFSVLRLDFQELVPGGLVTSFPWII